MRLAGQDARAERGYAMAALLVAMAVMTILLTVAMPVWRQLAQREKEEELVFRGKQYARAIGLFQRKYANAFPPTLDLLIEQKFLRRKYTDPVATGTDHDFQVLYQASQTRAPGQSSTSVPEGEEPATAPNPPAGAAAPGGVSSGPNGPRGGIIGVISKNKSKSIRLYNGRNRYSEWQFVYIPATMAPGGVPGSDRPGQPGAGGAGKPGGVGSRPVGPIRPAPASPRPPQ